MPARPNSYPSIRRTSAASSRRRATGAAADGARRRRPPPNSPRELLSDTGARTCWCSPGPATTAATRASSPKHAQGAVLPRRGSPTAARAREMLARRSQARWGLVVDGLFGIGLARAIEGDYAKLVDYANAQSCPVLALDIPSGLHSDTGRVLGRAVRATHTITFIAPQARPADARRARPLRRGRVADLGLDVAKLRRASGWIAEPALFSRRPQAPAAQLPQGHGGLARRSSAARAGMTGAALLAGARGAEAGRRAASTSACSTKMLRFDPDAPELMLRHPDDALGLDLDAIVDRPGPRPGRARRDAARRGAGERPALRARRRCAQPDRRERRPAQGLRAAQRPTRC